MRWRHCQCRPLVRVLTIGQTTSLLETAAPHPRYSPIPSAAPSQTFLSPSPPFEPLLPLRTDTLPEMLRVRVGGKKDDRNWWTPKTKGWARRTLEKRFSRMNVRARNNHCLAVGHCCHRRVRAALQTRGQHATSAHKKEVLKTRTRGELLCKRKGKEGTDIAADN